MSLRKKVFLNCLLAGLLFTCVLTFLFKTFFLKSYEILEKKEITETIERVKSALNNRLNSLDLLTSDWAFWDDTYQFVQDQNQRFLQSNITLTTFIDTDLDMILVTDKKKKIIFSQGIDIKLQKQIDLPYDLLNLFSSDSIFLNHLSVDSVGKGIVNTRDKPMLVVSRPILKSDKSGPIVGSFVMGRFLDDDELEKIIKVTHKSLKFFNLNKDNIPEKIKDIAAKVNEKYSYIEIVDDLNLSGYLLTFDLFQKPFLLFKVKMPRSFFQQGKLNFYYFISIFFVCCIIFAFAGIFLLHKVILSRLLILSEEVLKIGRSSDFSARVSVDGKDELTQAKVAINDMLLNLENALNDVDTLRGLLPICCHCKSIRDDKGYWNKLESFISKRSDAKFSHSLCPSCMKILYPEAYKQYELKQEVISKTKEDG